MEPGDAPAIHEMLVSGHTVAGTMRVPFAPLSTTEERLAPQDGQTVIVAVDDGELLGFAELMTNTYPRHNHVGEINMVVTSEEHQGRGVGRALIDALITISDDWFHLVRLQLYVWTTNTHAIRLYEELGFEAEGTLAKYARGRGTYLDALVMGRIRPPVT